MSTVRDEINEFLEVVKAEAKKRGITSIVFACSKPDDDNRDGRTDGIWGQGPILSQVMLASQALGFVRGRFVDFQIDKALQAFHDVSMACERDGALASSEQSVTAMREACAEA